MVQKQQALINAINKLSRQYFLFNEERGMDEVKVRMRSDIHRVEQVDPALKKERVLERIDNDRIGLMHPHHKPYLPVAGWPVIKLDELVFNTMAHRLDPKIWQALRSQFEKTEIKRTTEQRTYKDIINDFTLMHLAPTSGFNKIKAHVLESDARVQNVKAGFDFEQHFLRCHEERVKRRIQPQESVRQFPDDPDKVLAMERQRRDTILVLVHIRDFLDKLMLLRVRHLKSHTPINLNILGTDKDKEHLHSHRYQSRSRSTGPSSGFGHGSKKQSIVARPFHVQLQGSPNLQHSFKDQIIDERPPHWPIKVTDAAQTRSPTRRNGSRCHGSIPRPDSHASGESQRPKKYYGTGRASLHSNASDPPSGAGSDNLSRDDNPSHTTSSSSLRQRGLSHREITDRFRKIWPPVWMSLASHEQGCYIVDPACPTKEYNQCLNPTPFKKRKNFSNIIDTRQEWADMRQQVSRNVEENLWRVDKEKVEAFHVKYATLSKVPLLKPYVHHERQVEELLKVTRRQRQKKEIYDCELSQWYKYLVKQVQAEVGKTDEEVNAHLEAIKIYFRMSDTYPKLGKAKLALLTMSLPAYVACQVCVQRALIFILTRVLQAPAPLLTGWLAARGLPLVVLKSHVI